MHRAEITCTRSGGVSGTQCFETTHDEERHIRQCLDVPRQWQFLVLVGLEDSSGVRLGYTGFVSEIVGTEEEEVSTK